PRLGLTEEVKPKAKKTVKKMDMWDDTRVVNPFATVEPTIRFENDRENLRELIPTFNMLNSSVSFMNERTRFSYILNYAKTAGNNPTINGIADNDTNYRAFMALTNNMNDRVAA